MTKDEFISMVTNSTKGELIAEGFRQWDGDGLLLIPGKFYDSIPQGFEITTLSYKKEKFVSGWTDDDTRFGCLAYGIIKK